MSQTDCRCSEPPAPHLSLLHRTGTARSPCVGLMTTSRFLPDFRDLGRDLVVLDDVVDAGSRARRHDPARGIEQATHR